ncbi:MAG: hypothetical protein ABW000_09310 [Actinoplanes sp.]
MPGAEPLGPVRVTNTTANRSRRYDRVREWPAGLVALSDAVAAYHPVYGHGMSIAARKALTRACSLNAPPTRFFDPRTVLATARGPCSAPPAEPPFTDAERA